MVAGRDAEPDAAGADRRNVGAVEVLLAEMHEIRAGLDGGAPMVVDHELRAGRRRGGLGPRTSARMAASSRPLMRSWTSLAPAGARRATQAALSTMG